MYIMHMRGVPLIKLNRELLTKLSHKFLLIPVSSMRSRVVTGYIGTFGGHLIRMAKVL